MPETRPIKLLIIAELDGEISTKEKEFLYDWISKSENNARYYTQIKDLWEASVSNVSDLASTSQEWERFTRRIAAHPKKTEKRFRITSLYRVAAVLAIALLISSLLIAKFKTVEPVFFTAIAPKGSVSQTVLPDGSLIYLNAGSEIQYQIDNKSNYREVSIKGEAWFYVVKNEEKPFIVHTQFYDVKVLGTQFNIKTYEEEETVVTTLEEGSIQVLSTDNFKLEEEIVLSPGEQLVFNKKSRELFRNKVETDSFTSWKENKLVFLKMSFGDLVKLLERRYGVEIEVTDESLLEGHYTGTIKNESILEIMNIIKHTHPINYEINEQKIVISKK